MVASRTSTSEYQVKKFGNLNLKTLLIHFLKESWDLSVETFCPEIQKKSGSKKSYQRRRKDERTLLTCHIELQKLPLRHLWQNCFFFHRKTLNMKSIFGKVANLFGITILCKTCEQMLLNYFFCLLQHHWKTSPDRCCKIFIVFLCILQKIGGKRLKAWIMFWS